MPNPFVYGEVVPRQAFVDREIELDRLTRDLLAGQKIFLISPRRYRQIVAGPPGARRRRARRRADGRGHGQQLQLLRRVPRGIRPRAAGRRDANRQGARVAARDARRASVRKCGSRPTRTGKASSRSRFPRRAPAGTSRGSRRKCSRCPGASPRRAGASWRSPSTNSRRWRRSMAAASSMRCARRCSISARSAMCSRAPNRA